MSSNVIDIREYRELDPILRKGDVVRFVGEVESAGETLMEDFLGYTGLVTEIVLRWGEDTDAPGQAKHVMVAVPFEEGWEQVPAPVSSLHRVLGQDSNALRGYEADTGCV